MGNFQYTGGAAASFANALANAGQGYEAGIDDRLKREQEEATTKNLEAVPQEKIASYAQWLMANGYAHDMQGAMDAAGYAYGKPPPAVPQPSASSPPPPPVPAVPSAAPERPIPALDLSGVGVSGMDNRLVGSVPQFTPPPRPVPTQNAPPPRAAGVPPAAVPPPVPNPAPSAPPPPVPGYNSPIDQIMKPITPASVGWAAGIPKPPPLSPINRPVPPPPGLGPVDNGAPPPRAAGVPPVPPVPPVPASIPPPSPISLTGVPNVPQPPPMLGAAPPPAEVPGGPSAPAPYKPFNPQDPLPDPLELRRMQIMMGGREAVQDAKNLPIMQKTFLTAIGNRGILPTDDAGTRADKLQQQLSIAQTMDGKAQGPFWQMVMNSGGGIGASDRDTTQAQRVTQQGTHYADMDAAQKERADSYMQLNTARIPEITARAGLFVSQGKFYDAQTGEVVPKAQAQIALDGARAKLAGVEATELPAMDTAKIALEGAQGAAATENANTNSRRADIAQFEASVRSTLAQAGIKVDQARFDEIKQNDKQFGDNVSLLKGAWEAQQRAEADLQNAAKIPNADDRAAATYEAQLALIEAKGNVKKFMDPVYTRVKQNGAAATPSTFNTPVAPVAPLAVVTGTKRVNGAKVPMTSVLPLPGAGAGMQTIGPGLTVEPTTGMIFKNGVATNQYVNKRQ